MLPAARGWHSVRDAAAVGAHLSNRTARDASVMNPNAVRCRGLGRSQNWILSTSEYRRCCTAACHGRSTKKGAVKGQACSARSCRANRVGVVRASAGVIYGSLSEVRVKQLDGNHKCNSGEVRCLQAPDVSHLWEWMVCPCSVLSATAIPFAFLSTFLATRQRCLCAPPGSTSL